MSPGITFDEVSLADIKDPNVDAWRRLAASIGANPSLFPSWTEVIADSHELRGNCFVVTVYQSGDPVAVYPLLVSSRQAAGLRYRSLDLISNRAAYHNQTVSKLDPSTETEVLVDLALARGADMLNLSGMTSSSRLGQYLDETESHRLFYDLSSPAESSPYLSLIGDWEELLSSKPKKFRYKARQRAKLLTGSLGLRIQWYTEASDCRGFLDAVKTIEQYSWKKEAGLAIFDRPVEERYHRMLLPSLAARKEMFGNILFKKDQPIAYSLCCISGSWAGQLKTSFDSRFSELSPGGIVIDSAIQCAIDHGATEFDFLGGADPHKLAWTKSIRTHTNHFLYLKSTIRGRMIGALKKFRIRGAK